MTRTGGGDEELTEPLVDEGDAVRVDELLVVVAVLEPDAIGMLSCDATLGMMFLAATTTREHSADPEYCAHDLSAFKSSFIIDLLCSVDLVMLEAVYVHHCLQHKGLVEPIGSVRTSEHWHPGSTGRRG